DGAVVERFPFAAIDRRLAVLGADEDQRRFRQAAALQGLEHRPDRPIDKADRIGEIGAWRTGRVRIASDTKLLSDTYRLKIHTKERWCANAALAGVIEAIDLV